MRKSGKIPPHFLYFLENEGIEICDFRSSNFARKDNYDRVVVKFPYSITTLDIQVIFDNLEYSTCPDFVLVKENSFPINYSSITQEWNFKESSTLYNSLNKIKECYASEQERKLFEEINDYKQLNDSQYGDHASIFLYVEKIIHKLKSRFANYKQIPLSSCFIDINLNYGQHSQKKDFPEKYANHIIISYPADFLLRSRNINRSPIINIFIPITYDMKFYVEIKTPHFVSLGEFKFLCDFYELKNYDGSLNKIENNLFECLKDLKTRELVINKILDANFGFPLEIDTLSFSKFSLYFHFNKNNMSLANSSFKAKGLNQTSTVTQSYANNLLLYFNFLKDEKKLEFQIVNCDMLKLIAKMRFDYSSSEIEVNNLLSSILETLLENISKRK